MSPRIRYIEKGFKAETLSMIQVANQIIVEYEAQGYRLTVRQLYYQFVARDLIPNTMRSYKRLAKIVNDGRMAGLIDWDAIEDRTRNLESLPNWDDPADALQAMVEQFRTDKWARQPTRIEVWIEKEALAGVFEPVCEEFEIPFLCCRGYLSQSEMWGAAQRLRRYEVEGQDTVILHFGDHDPSGMDMTRDTIDRQWIFQAGVDVRRIALNMDQIEEHDPPPNPAKMTDSRFEEYLREFGDECWEIDALEPAVLAELVRTNVHEIMDETLWDEAVEEDEAQRSNFDLVARNWDRVVGDLDNTNKGSP